MTFAACPDSELLAACAEGRLRGDERERVLRHLTTCHDCYTVFTEALHLLDELPTLVAETAESRVPLASLPARQQPVKPSPAEPAAPRSHDGSTPATVPATPTPSSLGQPDAPDTAKPDNRGGESRDNVVPFDRRRRRRVATVALPLAAAAALTVVVMQQHPPQPPISSPVTVAQAPSPEPTPVATPTSAPLRLRSDRLSANDFWRTPAEPPGFHDPASPDPISCLVGVMTADLEVALSMGPAHARKRADWAVIHLGDAHARPELISHYNRLAAELKANQPIAGRLFADEHLYDVSWMRACRALEIIRLAARARDPEALADPGIAIELASAPKLGLDVSAVVRRVPPRPAERVDWPSLNATAERILREQLP